MVWHGRESTEASKRKRSQISTSTSVSTPAVEASGMKSAHIASLATNEVSQPEDLRDSAGRSSHMLDEDKHEIPSGQSPPSKRIPTTESTETENNANVFEGHDSEPEGSNMKQQDQQQEKEEEEGAAVLPHEPEPATEGVADSLAGQIAEVAQNQAAVMPSEKTDTTKQEPPPEEEPLLQVAEAQADLKGVEVVTMQGAAATDEFKFINSARK